MLQQDSKAKTMITMLKMSACLATCFQEEEEQVGDQVQEEHREERMLLQPGVHFRSELHSQL